jgi:hypothetical protein
LKAFIEEVQAHAPPEVVIAVFFSDKGDK